MKDALAARLDLTDEGDTLNTLAEWFIENNFKVEKKSEELYLQLATRFVPSDLSIFQDGGFLIFESYFGVSFGSKLSRKVRRLTNLINRDMFLGHLVYDDENHVVYMRISFLMCGVDEEVLCRTMEIITSLSTHIYPSYHALQDEKVSATKASRMDFWTEGEA